MVAAMKVCQKGSGVLVLQLFLGLPVDEALMLGQEGTTQGGDDGEQEGQEVKGNDQTESDGQKGVDEQATWLRLL